MATMAAMAVLPNCCSVSCAKSVSSAGLRESSRNASTAGARAVLPLNIVGSAGKRFANEAKRESSGKRSATEGKRESSIRCSGADGSSSTTTSTAEAQESWVPVIPFSALPRGERRLIRQDEDTVLLLWYKDEVYAMENTSPAEGAYSEGFFNARLTADGCIVCPSTETTFDLKTGEIKDWYPTNPILAFLTRPTRQLDVYPVKTDGEYVYINTKKGKTGQSAEIVFGGQIQAGRTATDVSVDEVRMVVDENETGFGFTPYTELVNGRAAMVGFTTVLLTELITGQGFLKGLGFLDFLYKYIK